MNQIAQMFSRLAAIGNNDLTRLANKYGSDKGSIHFAKHNYARIYHRQLKHLRGSSIRLLEIGLLHVRDPGWGPNGRNYAGTAHATRAPSLQMWAEYFPKGMIFGFDINDFSAASVERCEIFRGDMGSRCDLSNLVEASGGKFDIVIDDASHASHHQQIAFAYLFPHVTPGGIYIIEDLHWQPEELEKTDVPKTVDVLKGMDAHRVVDSPYIKAEEASYLAGHTSKIVFYDSLSPLSNKSQNMYATALIYKARE
jgi:hypothetical protein